MTRLGACFTLMLAAASLASALTAEEWIDFSAPMVGAGGTGTAMGRGGSAGYYNPAGVASRPWEENYLQIQFDIPVTFGASLHGNSIRHIFDTVELANDLFDRFEEGAFNTGGGVDQDDFKFALGVFAALDSLDSLNGEGLYATTGAGIAGRFGKLLLPRDAIGFHIGGFGIGSINPIVDLDSLRGYRLTDESAAGFESIIGEAIAASGSGQTPSSSGGQQFSADLQAAGYSAASADALAAWAEDSGLNFGGAAADILFDFLVNTLNGTGTSLESGANPLEGNGSGFLIRGLSYYEVGLSYGFGLPIPLLEDWFSFGVTVKLMQGYVYSELLRIEDMDEDGIQDTLDRLQQKATDAYRLDGAARTTVGIDLGFTFTPQLPGLNTLAISLVARNVNGPEFRWKSPPPGDPNLIRFDTQVRAGAAYTLFGFIGLPLTFAIDMDLNRVASDIMPTYHTQFVRAGITFEPQFGFFGFGVRIGALQNLADAEQATTLTAGFGLRLFVIHLDFAGQMAVDTQNFGTTLDFEPLPQRAGFAIQLGVNVNF